MTEPTYDELEDGLAIDENGLDQAIMQQPDLFHRVAKASALWSSRRDAAKQQVTETEARVDAEIRHDLEVEGTRVTEAAVASAKAINRDVLAARTSHLEISTAAAEWSALKEAYQQRSYSLSNLTDLYVAGYFTDFMQPRTQARNAQDLRNRDAAEGRQAMNELRQQRTLQTRKVTRE